MKVIILIDAKNFERGIFNVSENRKEFRYIDFYKISSFIMGYLKNNQQYKDSSLQHIRTYFYTGEFTDKLINKIERFIYEKKEFADDLNLLLEKCKRDKRIQEEFFRRAKSYYFFEIRAKPLQFSPSDKKVLQKGVDVQLAADLVILHIKIYLILRLFYQVTLIY